MLWRTRLFVDDATVWPACACGTPFFKLPLLLAVRNHLITNVTYWHRYHVVQSFVTIIIIRGSH